MAAAETQGNLGPTAQDPVFREPVHPVIYIVLAALDLGIRGPAIMKVEISILAKVLSSKATS